MTVGVKHIKFWTVAGGELISKKGVLAKIPDLPEMPKMQTLLSLAFGAVSSDICHMKRVLHLNLLFKIYFDNFVLY